MMKITVSGNITGNELKKVNRKLLSAVDNLMKIGKETSELSLMSKQKKKTAGNLFHSFAVNLGPITTGKLLGFFMSGGDKAFYAKYVNDGHEIKTKYGTYGKTEPYLFMEDGLVEVKKNVEKEVDKALGVR